MEGRSLEHLRHQLHLLRFEFARFSLEQPVESFESELDSAETLATDRMIGVDVEYGATNFDCPDALRKPGEEIPAVCQSCS